MAIPSSGHTQGFLIPFCGMLLVAWGKFKLNIPSDMLLGDWWAVPVALNLVSPNFVHVFAFSSPCPRPALGCACVS